MDSSLPIGIFDSGIGGLTVFKEIAQLLPNENLIYLGDVARVPYGSRSKEIITKFALELVDFLLSKKVKALVVACNTISASSLEEIKKITSVPLIDVINPTSQQASMSSKNKKIAVIATRATINSQIYPRTLKNIDPSISVTSISCPLFVPFVEEGQNDSPALFEVAKDYLKNLNSSDTLILGCTHYPVIKQAISQIVGPSVKIVDSALPTAQQLKKVLAENNLLNEVSSVGTHQFFVTDVGQNTLHIAQNILVDQNEVKLEKAILNDKL